MSQDFAPELRTPPERHSRAEEAKRRGLAADLAADLRDLEQQDLPWDSEQIIKSYGIYLEYNRAKSGREKDWIYMLRVAVPGGGPLSPEQWALLDALSEEHGRDPLGRSSLRLTTRGSVQLHWVKKAAVLPIVKALAESGILGLNACGDNVRGVVACPLSPGSTIADGHRLAGQIARRFRLPGEALLKIFAIDPQALDRADREALERPEPRFAYGPQLLNRKFKIGIAALHEDPESGAIAADNCVEVRTHDVGLIPLLEDGRVARYQLTVGGGQGEKLGKPTAAMLGQAFAAVEQAAILPTLEAIVAVQQEWGDRRNRHWARLKYVVRKQGLPWLRAQVSARLGWSLAPPVPKLDPGPRRLHHGWHRRGGSWSFGAFIENGRITDASPNGRLKSLVRALTEEFQCPVMVSPNQDLVFTDIADEARGRFEARLADFGYGLRGGRPYSALRLGSGSCVGKDTCRVAYTDSERFEPRLIDRLEALGWGELATSIGVTGCERQCFRPATKAVGLIGSGKDTYLLKLFGSEDGRHQGRPLELDGRVHLSAVPGGEAAAVIDALLRFHRAAADPGEELGAFHRRVGDRALIDRLRAEPGLSSLFEGEAERRALPV